MLIGRHHTRPRAPILRVSRTPRSSSRARDPVREIRVDAFLPAVGFLEPLEELSASQAREPGDQVISVAAEILEFEPDGVRVVAAIVTQTPFSSHACAHALRLSNLSAVRRV